MKSTEYLAFSDAKWAKDQWSYFFANYQIQKYTGYLAFSDRGVLAMKSARFHGHEIQWISWHPADFMDEIWQIS